MPPARPFASAVVTGVSTGIGEAVACLFAARGVRVFGSVRRGEDAARLQQALGERFVPLLLDVTDAAAVHEAAAAVRDRLGGERLAGLVNNAGIAVPGPLMHLTADDLHRQFAVNVVAPVLITQAFLPLLGSDPALAGPPGRIVNVSSVAGRLSRPFVGAYAASKHALEALSSSLRRELLVYGIDVIVVEPGAVVTPIWDKAEAEGADRWEATAWGPAFRRFGEISLAMGRAGLPAERVAEVIWTALTVHRPKTRYAVLRRPVRDWWLPRLLPPRLVDRLIANRLDLRPRG